MHILDIETDGLLKELTKIHMLVAYDTKTDVTHKLTTHEAIEAFIFKHYDVNATEPEEFCGHNILRFDVPAMQKVFPKFNPHKNHWDTLVMTRLIYSEIVDDDMKLSARGGLPKSLIGSHSLEAWGYRLGNYKGDFKGPWSEDEVRAKAIAEWDYSSEEGEPLTKPGYGNVRFVGDEEDYIRASIASWLSEMLIYCIQDVRVTTKLYEQMVALNYSQESIQLEHDVARIINRQIARGVRFDVQTAQILYADLMTRRDELHRELVELFGEWYERDGKEPFVPKRDNLRAGYFEGCAFSKIKLVQFNPGSRAHIAKRLKQLYGWEPTEFTDSGQAKVDEKVLSGLDYEPVKKLLMYLLVEKRMGQIADGQAGWLRMVIQGRIHGDVATNGAVTGRMTHSKPNLAQVPKVQSNKQGILYGEAGGWGYECRALFGPTPGYALVGADASGLELRTLAHYMGRFDGGEYAKILLEGDIHTTNQHAAGLPTRDNAKTFIYGFLYGSGDEKTGTITGVTDEELREYKQDKTTWNKVKGVLAKQNQRKQQEGARPLAITDERIAKCIKGASLKEKFLAGLPALKALRDDVQQRAKDVKYLKGLDGRILKIRSAHAALNTLLQSAGAVILKRALVILDTDLQRAGWVPGVDYEFLLNIHDEWQIEVKPERADYLAACAKEAMTKAGASFKLRCRIDGDAKIGKNWAETH
jgi:DNA polymerase I